MKQITGRKSGMEPRSSPWGGLAGLARGKGVAQEAARQRVTTALVAAAPGVEDTRRADRKAAARVDKEAARMVISLDALLDIAYLCCSDSHD